MKYNKKYNVRVYDGLLNVYVENTIENNWTFIVNVHLSILWN